MCTGKKRQANVPKKKQKEVPSRPGYRMLIDISSFKQESMGGNRHWLIVLMNSVITTTVCLKEKQ